MIDEPYARFNGFNRLFARHGRAFGAVIGAGSDFAV